MTKERIVVMLIQRLFEVYNEEHDCNEGSLDDDSVIFFVKYILKLYDEDRLND